MPHDHYLCVVKTPDGGLYWMDYSPGLRPNPPEWLEPYLDITNIDALFVGAATRPMSMGAWFLSQRCHSQERLEEAYNFYKGGCSRWVVEALCQVARTVSVNDNSAKGKLMTRVGHDMVVPPNVSKRTNTVYAPILD